MSKLSIPLQESLLTLLATNEEEGRIAAGLVSHKDFDDTYKDIAQRILRFRKYMGGAPGKAHLSDIADDIIGNEDHKQHKAYIRIVDNILGLSDSLNSGYVLGRVEEFKRRQRIKGAILEAGELYQQGGEGFIDNVEVVLKRALKPVDDMGLTSGTFLNDRVKALSFLDSMDDAYSIGIPEFQKRGLGPRPGEMFMPMGAKGFGKSWLCIHAGRECLMQGAKVLHVTLEMSEKKVVKRYFQNFFAIANRRQRFNVQRFVYDDLGRIETIKTVRRKTKISLQSPDINSYLLNKMQTWGTRLGRLLVKDFPTKSLSVGRLDAYLEMLEYRHGFIPNVLIVDYPDLMYMDKKDPRISIGWTIEELRGLLQKRNLAGIMPTQTNRAGWDASTVKGSQVADDASKFRTADMVVICSQTKQEKELGLARLYVEKNRDEEDGYTVVITQNYRTGQFVLQSAMMHSNSYFRALKEKPSFKEKADDNET